MASHVEREEKKKYLRMVRYQKWKIYHSRSIYNLIENIFIAIDKPKIAQVAESDDEDVFDDDGEDDEFDESASQTDDLVIIYP